MKHFNLSGKNVVIGIAELSERTENNHTIPVDESFSDDINIGWRYVNGEFLPPMEPTEGETLKKELITVTAELRTIFDKEQFAIFLGESDVATLSTARSASSRKEILLKRRNEIKQLLSEIS